MNIHIRPMQEEDSERLIALTLSAFAPIFSSFAHILGPQIFDNIYPDWQAGQANEINTAWNNEKHVPWVAEVNGIVVGLISYELHHNDKTGEVQFLVVDPDYQNDGIGTELNNFALQKMHEAGMRMAVVGTGGDQSHEPAQRSYEKAGYTALPLVRYYKMLT